MIVPKEKNGSAEIPSKFNKYACACAIVASIISIIFGYDTGVMSGAMLFIKEDLKVDDLKVGILAGSLNIFALVGSLAAGRTSDKIGRRYTIVLASAIFLVGAVLMGYGPNYGVLLTGRGVAGVGVGFALMIAPVYSAEISSPSTRGLLSSLPELCISLGILLGYISNLAFRNLPLAVGWRVMLGIGGIPSIALGFGILRMPESPRWLVLQGRLGEARGVLSRVCNSEEEAARRLRDIMLAAGISDGGDADADVVVVPKEKSGGRGVWRELLLRPSPAVRWILLAAVGIHFFEHATGIEAVVLYSPRIFEKAGVKSKDMLLLATVGVGVTKTSFILVATFFLDRIGRRKLLLTSTGGMIVALSSLGFCLTMAENSKEQVLWALGLGIASVYLFIAFFSIGLGPITWVYSSEIFPLRLRAQGMSIGVAVNRLMNASISISFIPIYKALTIGGTFFLFSGIAVLALLFFYFLLPETKGVSLEEMENLFSRNAKNINLSNNGEGDLEIQTTK